MRALIASFQRDVNALVVSGVWCGDCVQQVPFLAHIERANPQRVRVRYLDRDANTDLAERVMICAGLRVPAVILMNEDFDFLALVCDRTLSRYRAMAQRNLGASCPLPGAPVDGREVAQTRRRPEGCVCAIGAVLWSNDMTRTQSITTTALAIALASGGALAQSITVHDGAGLPPIGARAGGPRNADGDLYGTVISVFGDDTAFHLDSLPDVHIFGGAAFMGTSSLEPSRALHVSTSENHLGGNDFELIIEWATDDQGAFLPNPQPGLGFQLLDTIGFEIGQGNAPAELIEWDPNPGFTITSATFEAFDTGGVDVLGGAGAFFASDNGGAGISGSAFVSVDGDIRQLDLAFARATITVSKVPTPSALSVLAITGALASRRRRR
eukprot:g5944.t1